MGSLLTFRHIHLPNIITEHSTGTIDLYEYQPDEQYVSYIAQIGTTHAGKGHINETRKLLWPQIWSKEEQFPR